MLQIGRGMGNRWNGRFLVGVVVVMTAVLVGCPSPVTPSDDATRNFDTEGPTTPTVSSVADSPYDTAVQWNWQAGEGGSGIFRYRLNGGEWNVVQGQTAYSPPDGLPPGTHTFEVQERDSAGNWSETAQFETTILTREPRSVSVYRSADATEEIGVAEQSDDPPPGFWTNSARPRFAWADPLPQFGIPESGDIEFTVRLDSFTDGGEWEPVETIERTTQRSYEVPAALAEGRYRVGVSAWSSGEVASAPTRAVVIVDTSAPAAPTVGGEPITSNARPEPVIFSIQADADDTRSGYEWELVDGDDAIRASGSTSEDSVSVALSEVAGGPGLGVYELVVRQVDLAGNVGAPGSLTVAVEAVPSVSYAGPSPTNDSTPEVDIVGNDPGSLTNAFQWSVNGTAGTGTFTAPEAMDEAFTRSVPDLGEGDSEIRVRQRRADGSYTSPSPPVTITVDTVAPAAPTIGSGPAEGAVLNAETGNAVTFSLTVEAGVVVAYTLTGDTLATVVDETVSDADGDGAITLPEVVLADDSYTFTANATDTAGNTSASATRSFTVDLGLPPSPTLDSTPAALSNDATPTIAWSGSGDAGATFRYELVDSGSTVVDSDTGVGATSYTPASALGSGAYTFSVWERDTALNESVSPATISFEIDVTPPGAPTGVTSADISAGLSAVVDPMFTWTAGGGGNGQFEYTTDGGITVNGPTSMTSVQPTLAVGTGYVFQVRERDDAGNWSAWSAPLSFDISIVGQSVVTITNPVSPTFSINSVAVLDRSVSDTHNVTVSSPGLTITGYTWLINGTVVDDGAPADEQLIDSTTAVVNLGSNTLTLIVDIGGVPYTEDFFFEVVED